MQPIEFLLSLLSFAPVIDKLQEMLHVSWMKHEEMCLFSQMAKMPKKAVGLGKNKTFQWCLPCLWLQFCCSLQEIYVRVSVENVYEITKWTGDASRWCDLVDLLSKCDVHFHPAHVRHAQEKSALQWNVLFHFLSENLSADHKRFICPDKL